MTRSNRARAASAAGEARSWKDRHDALLTVLNAILLAYGVGSEARLVVSNAYVGQRRREVVTEPMGERFIVYLAPVTEEEPHAVTSS